MSQLSESSDYELRLHYYASGFDEIHIAELCRCLTPDQVRLFLYYLQDSIALSEELH